MLIITIDELIKANEKDKILNDQDRIIIKEFISKIQKELAQ